MKLLLAVIGALAIGVAILLFTHHSPIVSDRIAVSASFYPLYFFANRIGGATSDIHLITPSGAEPHDYEPTAQDMVTLEHSAFILINGGSFESWAPRIQKAPGYPPVVSVGEKFITGKDPHVWLNPRIARQEAVRIQQAFIARDPVNEPLYRARTDGLIADLDQLDDDYRTGLASCRDNDVVTSHAAFGYLLKEYNLNQVSISGLSPDEEPSPKQLAHLAEYVKAHNIPVIFFEKLVSPRISETLAHETGARTLVLDPLEGVSAVDQARGVDYFTIMRENLTNLRTALSCQ